MFHQLEERIREHVSARVKDLYGVEAQVAAEQPRQPEFGEVALPVAFQLAKQLRRPPKAIARELAGALGSLEGVATVEVAGNGYLNVRLDRGWYARRLLEVATAEAPRSGEKIIVEHTNINPNKAAHIAAT